MDTSQPTQSLSDILSAYRADSRCKAIAKALRQKSVKIVSVGNVAGSAAGMMLASLPKQPQPIVVVADDADDAGYLFHDLSRLAGEQAVAMLPSAFRRHIKYGQIDAPNEIMRTEALSRWHTDSQLQFVVTWPEALAEKVASEKLISDHTLRISVKESANLNQTIKWLRDNAFIETDYVYEPGQFAHRGSILDIFGYSSEHPFRIDFFGDDIDSIRSFDIQTQLSVERIDQVAITSGVPSASSGMSLLDFVAPATLFAIRQGNNLLGRIENVSNETISTHTVIAEEGDSLAMNRIVNPDEFASKFSSMHQLCFSASELQGNESSGIDFCCSPQGLYHKNFDLIADSFNHFIEQGYKIQILSDSSKQIERLRTIFTDRGDNINFTGVEPTLHEGFVDHQCHQCIFTDHQIFDRFHKFNLKSDKARSGKLALSLKELQAIEPGDFIVHTDHGVGKFAGLLRTNVSGKTQEMIKLIYSGGDTIFVSIHSLHKLAKYRGKEGVPPKINKLGTGAWNKMKERTKSRLKDIARDLIRLYADRRTQKGYAFAPDSYMQHELEASFAYEDTPDQLTATRAVKTDMESLRPMDRLICGDVGFGKTEIAIRAAFKAAADSKQTAVLVPTTVLAYQHYNTFTKRLKDFPVRVDYLSRARTAKQEKEILADLAAGKIDILIGTHKIVGKNIKFKDLGLLVIDEEQKFGVAVKEKLKQMKTNVDTLTMSATPIPRTLQFSLMGARDLSAITTPPPNRRPILTNVSALTDEMMTEAIEFEMSRNGQVFIINNRIEGLTELEAMVHRLVPDARVIVAHGQMPPERLEKAIIDFANHDYDVLLATTIVESGIDMPNVNTIIINNAQNFGLSELHQLRGRVGRSARKAFCYLTVPPHVPLSTTARRRLQAIENFSDLGSGIHIAMQDLDIRGAGNLLGAEQSGFIADLGYETYQKILREAVTELRTEEFADLTTEIASDQQPTEFVADCIIESDLELLLPAWYVPQESERISLYQQLDSIERETDLLDFKRNLEDRFGKIPHETAELIRIPRLRRLARTLGIEKVALKQGKMYVYFVDESNRAYYQSPMFGRLLQYLQENPRRCAIREKSGRRSFAISSVDTVENAVEILSGIIALKGI